MRHRFGCAPDPFALAEAFANDAGRKEMLMQRWIGSFRLFGYLVVVLMVLAMVYSAFISITYWSGISV